MEKVGVRRMGFILGGVASVTYLISSQSSSLWVLYVTYGLVPGTHAYYIIIYALFGVY